MTTVRNKRGRRNMEYLISFLLMLAANIASGPAARSQESMSGETRAKAGGQNLPPLGDRLYQSEQERRQPWTT